MPISIALCESFAGAVIFFFWIKRLHLFVFRMNHERRGRGGLFNKAYSVVRLFLSSFRPEPSVLDGPIVVFIAVNALSILVSDYLALSLKGFFYKILEWTFLYFIILECVKTSRQVRFLLGVFLAAVTLVSINGLWQFHTGEGFIFAHKIIAGGRIGSCFRHPNDFGAYLLVPVMMVLSLLFGLADPGHKTLTIRRRAIGFILFLILAVLIIMNIGWTYSRAVYFGLFAGLICYLFSNRRYAGMSLLIIVMFGLVFTQQMKNLRNVSYFTDDTRRVARAIQKKIDKIESADRERRERAVKIEGNGDVEETKGPENPEYEAVKEPGKDVYDPALRVKLISYSEGGQDLRFSWKENAQAEKYWLSLASDKKYFRSDPWGDIYSGKAGPGGSHVVKDVPVTADKIYVCLWTLLGSQWQRDDFVLDAGALARHASRPKFGPELAANTQSETEGMREGRFELPPITPEHLPETSSGIVAMDEAEDSRREMEKSPVELAVNREMEKLRVITKEKIKDIKKFRASGRFNYWHEAIAIMADHLFLGTGVNTYSQVGRNYKISWGGYPHNCYLQMGAETGIPGLFAFLWIFWRFFVFSRRQLKKAAHGPLTFVAYGLVSGLFGFLVHAAFETSFYSVKLGNYLWLNLGLAMVIIRLLVPTKGPAVKGDPHEKQTR